jgi:hypothetical protein
MRVRSRLARGVLVVALAATGGLGLAVTTSGVAHASTGCQQYLTKAQYWQNQADDDIDAAISYSGSSVMIGDMLAFDYFMDAAHDDLAQVQFYSNRYNNCQNLREP